MEFIQVSEKMNFLSPLPRLRRQEITEDKSGGGEGRVRGNLQGIEN
jgi:hypothetical protein